MNKYLSFIYVLIIPIILNAQINDFAIPDSLHDKSYSELEHYFYNSKDQSDDLIYSNTYYLKGLKENDSVRIAKGLLFLTSNVKIDSVIEQLVDKAIIYSKNKNDFLVPCTAYSMKASLCKNKKQFKCALDYYFLANKTAKKSANIDLSYMMKYNIGLLKNEVGHHEETVEYMRDLLNYFKDKRRYSTYLNSLCILSNSYTYMNLLDSASHLNRMGYKESIKLSDSSHYYFTFYEGINKFYQGKISASKDSILKSLAFIEKSDDKNKIAISYYYLGKIYKKLASENLSKTYLLKIDSMFISDEYLPFYCRDSYKILSKGDKNNELYYNNQLLKLDSVLYQNYRKINTTIYKGYEQEEIVSTKQKIIDTLNNDNKYISTYALVFLILMSVFGVALILNYKKRKKDQIRFNDILNKQKIDSKQKVSKNERIKDIDEMVVKNVLDNLTVFEDKEQFLEKGLSINDLAKIVETNSKYLSIIINHYKQKTFSNYINDLRIDYIVEKLKKDKKYRNYNMTGLSEESGFSNRRSFSIAFNKRTNLSLKYFINKIHKES
ncbi:helix-turn-helix domain-containing protein [Kordia jejudonensis]|uniref:helix-turn-helix domain-containing protein n=1 Tax=Kordia jejudonensis TaxID=1348245 RepID=UPI0006298CD3|nr:AraC family transcriptional regulator [Kordia jejudonensis]